TLRIVDRNPFGSRFDWRVRFTAQMSAPKMLRPQLSRSEGNRRGNTGGEHPLRARCSPSLAPDFTRIGVDANALQRPTASANFNQPCELRTARIGRRSLPPAQSSAVSEAVNRSTVA